MEIVSWKTTDFSNDKPWWKTCPTACISKQEVCELNITDILYLDFQKALGTIPLNRYGIRDPLQRDSEVPAW